MRAINGLIADVPVCDAARGSLSSHPALEVLDPALGARDSQPALRRGTSLITALPRQRALTNDQPYRFKLHLKLPKDSGCSVFATSARLPTRRSEQGSSRTGAALGNTCHQQHNFNGGFREHSSNRPEAFARRKSFSGFQKIKAKRRGCGRYQSSTTAYQDLPKSGCGADRQSVSISD